MGIPIIDFAKCALNVKMESVKDEDKKTIGESIYEAFATVGFVYLKNTGVQDDQVESLHAMTKRFFNLDLETKKKYQLDSNVFGYVGLGVEKVNPDRPGDYKEAFELTGVDALPETTVWPDEDVPGFRESNKKFCYICRELAERILTVLTFGMDIKDKDYFMRSHSRLNGKDNYTSLRLLSYPPVPDNDALEPDQIRLGEHTDYGSFTLLFQDQTGGLEVETVDGEYVEAVPIPGTVLVNIGDALQFWTRGRLKSTKHRIVNEAKRKKFHRTSVIYFVLPDHETLLSEIEYGSSSKYFHTPVKGDYDKVVTAYEHTKNLYEKTNMLST